MSQTFHSRRCRPSTADAAHRVPLNIIVVGAGIGGLAATHTLTHARHRVTLLEFCARAGRHWRGDPSLISTNATRTLLRWDLNPALVVNGVEPTAIVFQRYDAGVRIGYTRWGSRMTRDHGAPYYHIHRTDYAILHRLTHTAPGLRICLDAPVRTVQPDPSVVGGPNVTLACGEVLSADLVVGADDVKSKLQKAVTGLDDRPMPTGDAAYRAVVGTDLLFEDLELRPFVETPEMTAWDGAGPSPDGLLHCEPPPFCLVTKI